MPLAITMPIEDHRKVDVYIDNTSTVIPDLGNNRERGAAAVPLAIHTVGRPIHGDEPLPRDDLMALKKLLAEGGLEETKTLLGWFLNTRWLLITLPDAKFHAWKNSILKILEPCLASFAQLNSLIS